MAAEPERGHAEELARSVHQVVVEGGDLEAVVRRLLALDPSSDALADATRWARTQPGHDDTWESVANALIRAREVGPFHPRPVEQRDPT